MAIKVGDTLPEAKFRVMTGDGPVVKSTDDVFKGKKVALFAVPGAYTGTCHKMHMPSIFLNAYAIKDKGVDTIAVTSVNDAFVMGAWKKIPTCATRRFSLPTAMQNLPRPSASNSMPPAMASAFARIVTRCWSMTAS